MKRGLFMSYMNTHAAFAPAGGIQELSFDEVEIVSGGRPSASGTTWSWEGVAAAAGTLSIASGVAGAVPSPATPGFLMVAATTGLIAIGASWAASVAGQNNKPDRGHVKKK
jgi:hypothetical protein